MVRMGLAMLLLLLVLPADAGRHDAVRKQVEASMVLKGTIDVDDAGKVVAYAVDDAEKVDAAALDVLSRHVPAWRFEPVVLNGQAVHARSRMRVRLVATPLDSGDYSVSIKDTDFPPLAPAQPQPKEGPVSVEMRAPSYPKTPLYVGASGMVVVVARIGFSGNVEDAVVEQVNLGAIGEDRDMELWRKQFGDAAIKAAKASQFTPYGDPDGSAQPSSVRIPYVFELSGSTIDRPYGQWSAYLPGPRQPVPWLLGVQSGAPDLLASGEMLRLGDPAGLKRLTSPGGG